jgi:hypothetical protein
MPRVQANFTKEELDALGEQMETVFDELIQTEPRNQVPTQTEVAPPI